MTPSKISYSSIVRANQPIIASPIIIADAQQIQDTLSEEPLEEEACDLQQAKKIYRCVHIEVYGECLLGNKCKSAYARLKRQHAQKPKLQKHVLCQNMTRFYEGCIYGDNCIYAHSEEERNLYLEDKPCRQWLYEGKCKQWKKCKFQHPENREEMKAELYTHKCDFIKDKNSICPYAYCCYNHDPNYIDPHVAEIECQKEKVEHLVKHILKEVLDVDQESSQDTLSFEITIHK